MSNVTVHDGEKVAACRPVVHRWYLGGIASATAAACTHPLDLLKVYSYTTTISGCLEARRDTQAGAAAVYHYRCEAVRA